MGKNSITSLYSETTKLKKNRGRNYYKNVKIKKRSYAYKGHASTYNVNIIFNPELHLKITESATKN